MPSPRPSAGSPLRGRLRRGLQEEKSPRRNMLRGPSTSVAPATGPHLRLSSSPPPETSGTSLRLCCAATASPRHGPSASNPGCADDGPSRLRLPATSTHRIYVTSQRLQAPPVATPRRPNATDRHPPLVKQPRLRRRRDRSSVTCRRWAIPTPVHVRHPADRPDAPQTAALRQATAPPIGRHSSRPPAPPNATIQPPVTVQRFTLRHRNTPRFAGAVFTREERRGAAITIHSPASSRSLGSTS